MSRRIATDRDQRNAQQLLDKVRRTASDNDHYDVLYHQPEGCSTRAVPGHGSLNLAVVRKNVETLEGLRQLVVGLVKLRLQAEYIKHPSDTHMHMSWCLPQALPDQPFWRLLLEDPLSLTKEMLETLILLHEWNADSPKVDPNSAVNRLYIRTLEVPVALLKGILNDMSEQGYNTLERVHYWQQRIEEEMDDETIFTLRYCGQTKDSPWVRHTSDMYSSIETFFGRFMLSLGQSEEGRKVLRAIKVHSVAGAIETVSREQADLREQILIAMFRDCSLNTQAGGKDVITLYNEDRRNFELLQSQTIALLYSQTRSCTAAETEDIRKYASDVRRYVDKNPSTTKNKAFNEHTEAMIRDQGTPSMLPNGSAVMVTVASDLGEGHDSSEDSFWEAGGRSAEAVGYIYNHFASWEGPTALESVDPQKFKQLARDGYLPLVDRWPWYSKEDKDSAKASELLGRYMNAVRPMIVFTYGEEQLFAAQCNFGLTNAQTFASWKKACRTPGVALPRGVPYLGHFDGKDSDNNPESATVIIPSFHPGFLSRGGIVKDKATRVFVLTAAVAWCAMSCALQIASEGMPVSREEYAKQIIVRINQLAGPTTEFGRTLSRAKQEYADCHQAYSEAAAKRSKAPTMKMPVNIVPRKSFRAARRSRYSTAVTVVKDSVGGWQLSIEEDSNISGRPEFYKLSWKEEDGTTWEIAPLPLSDDVVLANNTTKCFLYFDKCGLDVRDADGNTLGTRAPLASKKAKTITLPISMIFLAMSVVSLDGALTFVEHWEDVTQSVFADEVMSEHSPDTSKQLEGSLPVEFFDKYSSCRSLPFPAKVLKLKATWDQMKSKAQPGLPAQPSDLLWLLEQFFSEIAPNGGHWDPVSTSEHPTYSVYTKLMNFACRPKYKHHPHNITLKAMAHLSEQGQDDRRVPYNMLLLAGEFLRPGGKMSKKKNLRRTLPNGDKIDTTRFFRELPAGPAKSSVVARVKLPKIEKTEDGLGHVSDETVDSSGDDSDDDSDGDSDGDASLVLAGKTSRGGSTRASSRDAGFAGRGSGRSNDSTAGRTDRKSPSGGASDADRGDSKGTYKKRRTGKDDHYSARKSEGTKRRKPDDDGDEKEDPASKTARTGMDKKIRRTRAV